MYRRVETLLRLTLEERGAVLPEGEKLELLARTMKSSNGEALQRMLSSTMKNVRQTFLSLSHNLSSRLNEPS